MIDEIMVTLGNLPPGLLLIIGALLIPFLHGRTLQTWLVVLPLISFVHMQLMPVNARVEWSAFGLQLIPVRVDSLSLVWGYIFHAATLISVVYALQVKDRVQQAMSLVYAGSAIAAVFAGDLLTLFIFWEITAISSVFLVWAGRYRESYPAGMRYLLLQVGSGVLLLAGTILYFHESGTLEFQGAWNFQDGLAFQLIFVAFGIKAAFPLLHCWLPDSYPAASPTGTVFLSIYTTKLAIYSLARGFAGTEELVIIGVVMAVFPLVYALLADDLRKVLAYSLNNQLGFMVVGIGIGSELALNGTAGHAVSHILYKGLLFMAVGAVITQTGTGQASKLGGLLKAMPWTATFCVVGSLGMATPLFAGYVTKSMIFSAVAKAHYDGVWLLLLISSAGVFLASGLRICYEIFMGERCDLPAEEAPFSMRVAMGLSAVGLISIGCAPHLLFNILPYDVDYNAYTTSHVINQFQLLFFTGLGFAVLIRLRLYPGKSGGTLLDFDWTYRVLIPAIIRFLKRLWQRVSIPVTQTVQMSLGRIRLHLEQIFCDKGFMGRARSTGWMAMWVVILLAAYLLSYYEGQAVERSKTDSQPPAAGKSSSNGGSIFASWRAVD